MGASTGIGRRRAAALAVGCACVVALLVTSPALAVGHASSRRAHATLAATRGRIDALVRRAITAHDLNAVIVSVSVDGRPLFTKAYGESMTGVPATVQMHFRNGAVAISYVSTLLLRLVDEKRVKLDDPISMWLPGLRDSRLVTLRMLAGMSAGYPDYVRNPTFGNAIYANPFSRSRHTTSSPSRSARPNCSRPARTGATRTPTT